MRQWYETNEKGTDGVPSGLRWIREYEEMNFVDACERVLQNEKVYCRSIVEIRYIRQDQPSYEACRFCNKGIRKNSCEHVGEYGTQRRYLLEIHLVCDDRIVIGTAFDEVGRSLFKRKAEDFEMMKVGNFGMYNDVLRGICGREYKMDLIIEAKDDDKMGDKQISCTITNMLLVE